MTDGPISTRLAVTVYELLAGRRPYEETGTAVMVRLGQAQGPPELHVLCPNVPEGLSKAIHRGLAKDPASRYPTCTDFATAVLGQVRAFSPTQKMAEGAAHGGRTRRPGVPVVRRSHGRPGGGPGTSRPLRGLRDPISRRRGSVGPGTDLRDRGAVRLRHGLDAQPGDRSRRISLRGNPAAEADRYRPRRRAGSHANGSSRERRHPSARGGRGCSRPGSKPSDALDRLGHRRRSARDGRGGRGHPASSGSGFVRELTRWSGCDRSRQGRERAACRTQGSREPGCGRIRPGTGRRRKPRPRRSRPAPMTVSRPTTTWSSSRTRSLCSMGKT